jgi:hypothetical protein
MVSGRSHLFFFEEKQEGQAPTVNAFQSKDRVQSTKYKEKQGTRMKEQKRSGKSLERL